MIVIDILNSEQVAENHAGKFQLKVAKVMRVDLKRRIEKAMAKELKKEMEENGLKVDVWVEQR